MSENLYKVSSSPHIRANYATETIMRDVVLALLPATAFGIYNFGYQAALIILISIATCVGSEFLYQKLTKQMVTIDDYSAVVTGLLLALVLPPYIPYWIPVVGGIFAIIVVKQLFGGLGQNFVNPALAARIFLTLAYSGYMITTGWEKGDAVTSATPLAASKLGEATPELMKLFVGNITGCIGETSAIALLIGAVYLLARRIISIRIPLVYILTVAVFAAFAGEKLFDIEFIMFHILAGGLLIGAFFMATDYVTSPVTPLGQIIYAFFIGIFTMLIRLYSNNPEGVSFAIMFMNLWVPIIEKFTRPKVFGEERKYAGK